MPPLTNTTSSATMTTRLRSAWAVNRCSRPRWACGWTVLAVDTARSWASGYLAPLAPGGEQRLEQQAAVDHHALAGVEPGQDHRLAAALGAGGDRAPRETAAPLLDEHVALLALGHHRRRRHLERRPPLRVGDLDLDVHLGLHEAVRIVHGPACLPRPGRRVERVAHHLDAAAEDALRIGVAVQGQRQPRAHRGEVLVDDVQVHP